MSLRFASALQARIAAKKQARQPQRQSPRSPVPTNPIAGAYSRAWGRMPGRVFERSRGHARSLAGRPLSSSFY